MTARRSSLAVLFAAFVLLVSSLAHAAEWTPPPLNGHVVDEAHALDPQQTLALDRKLDRARRETGFAVVVYLLPKLPDGLSIEDVGYKAGNAWGVGTAKGDDGVLLLASLGDRKLRIETGKGAGGALTDIGSSRINREVIGPLMKQGRIYEAMDRGTDAILAEMAQQQPEGSEAGKDPSRPRRPRTIPAPAEAQPVSMGRVVIWGVIGLAVLVLAIVSPTFRQILFFWLMFGGGRRGGGGGGGGWGGGDGGGGGSGYSGGGGSFGGGGSSDDY